MATTTNDASRQCQTWTYRKCKELYGGEDLKEDLARDDPPVLVHTSSMAVTPDCLHRSELLLWRARVRSKTSATPFESSGLGVIQPSEHTMAYSLPGYCLGKVPADILHKAVQLDQRVCVWGAFDAHVLEYAWERGYFASLVPVPAKTKKDPLLNRERPRVFFLRSLKTISKELAKLPSHTQSFEEVLEGIEGFYVLAVFPGSDYVYHYGRMAMQTMELLKAGSSSTLLEVRRFPHLERQMADWTAFKDVPIESTDLVVLGHVRDYYSRLKALDDRWLDCNDPVISHCVKMVSVHQEQQQNNWHETMPFWRLFEDERGPPQERFVPPHHKELKEELRISSENENVSTMDAILEDLERSAKQLLQQDSKANRRTLSIQVEELCRAEDVGLEGETFAWCNYAWEVLPLKYGDKAVATHSYPPPFKRIFFLGARYSYWGNCVYPLAREIYSAKSPYILYAGKCGTLTNKDDIHKVAIPYTYATVAEPVDSRDYEVEHVMTRGFDFFYRRPGDFDTLEEERASKRLLQAHGGTNERDNGLHVSVPTIVGETYAQRDEIAQSTQKMADLRVLLRMCFDQAGDNAEAKGELRKVQWKLQNGQLTVEAAILKCIMAMAAHYPKSVEFLCQRWERAKGSEPEEVLLSIDNETSWFARAAGDLAGEKKVIQGVKCFFSSIHRTTDYVRRRSDRADITQDDLAREQGHSGEREEMLRIISGIIYKLLRQFLRFSDLPLQDPHVARCAELMQVLREPGMSSLVRTVTPALYMPHSSHRSLKWGVLGAAKIAKKFVASCSMGASTISGVASRDLQKAEGFIQDQVAKGHLTRSSVAYGSYQAMLDDPNIDAVYLPLPNNLHAEWAENAIKKGKHVLVEKPFALRPEDIDHLMKLAGTHSVHVCEAMLPMFHPLLQNLRRSLHHIGKPLSAKLVYIHPLDEGCIAFSNVAEGGGAMWALGCYLVALARSLFGDLRPLSAIMCPHQTGCDSSFGAVLSSNSGVMISISCGILGRPAQELSIIGDLGTITVEAPFRPGTDGEPSLLVAPSEGDPTEYKVDNISAFQAQLMNFEHSVLYSLRGAYPLSETLACTRTILELLKMAGS